MKPNDILKRQYEIKKTHSLWKTNLIYIDHKRFAARVFSVED